MTVAVGTDSEGSEIDQAPTEWDSELSDVRPDISEKPEKHEDSHKKEEDGYNKIYC